MRFSRVSMFQLLLSTKKARHLSTPGLRDFPVAFQVSAAQRMHDERQGRLFGLELDDIRWPIYFRQITHMASQADPPALLRFSVDIIKTRAAETGS
jgi:hypothetical protein